MGEVCVLFKGIGEGGIKCITCIIGLGIPGPPHAQAQRLAMCDPVFELRKNKWLSHGQPSYNIWLSVQVFGCPYLEQGVGIT